MSLLESAVASNAVALICTHLAAGLRTLNLRQNILPDVSALDSCQCNGVLEDLEVRDNLLTEVGPTRRAPVTAVLICWLTARDHYQASGSNRPRCIAAQVAAVAAEWPSSTCAAVPNFKQDCLCMLAQT